MAQTLTNPRSNWVQLQAKAKAKGEVQEVQRTTVS